MFSIFDFELQLKIAIKALELKCNLSNEPIVSEYLDKYKSVLQNIHSGCPDEDIKKNAKKLLNCTRGYLETSGNYQQDFLNEMAKTEKQIKRF